MPSPKHACRLVACAVAAALPSLCGCDGSSSTGAGGKGDVSPPSIDELALVPQPVSVATRAGAFTLAAEARIAVSAGAEEVGERLAEVLRPSTGFAVPVVTGDAVAGDLALRLDDGSSSALGQEGYRLEVSAGGVTVTAAAAAGLFYGCQTLRQLLPADVERRSLVAGVDWSVPHVIIEDLPRFEWRGAMLDVARHFFGVPEVERYVDLVAYHKMNRLHLHLTDDQGWRVEITSWPDLTTIGGATEVGGGPGGFYTQADVASIVAYAAERFVTVVPEIDMPGHVNAALASYGELNPSGEPAAPYTGTSVGFSSLWLDGPITATFVHDVIGEVAGLFPSPYLHIGGDEAHATPKADYVAFIEAVQSEVALHQKTLVGWEEIGAASLAPPFHAQFWLSDEKARAARDRGARIIASPVVHAYLDIKYDGSTPIGQSYIGFTEVDKAYLWDPVMAGLTEADIEGVEAPLWTETVATLEDIELLAFPRLAGHAEIAWSPKEGRTWDSYRERLARHGTRLDALGVGFHRSPLVPWR